jgi:zinc/manganese transport system substrate-binding protein
MKHHAIRVALVVLALAGAATAAGLKIVTTTSDLAAIAKAVAGDKAEVHSICTGKEDPHMLQAKPSCILLARDADLWVRIGLELEIGWEPPILDGSRNPRVREGARGHLDAAESALVSEAQFWNA